MKLRAAETSWDEPTFSGARETLWMHLSADKLDASGVTGQKKVLPIPATEWPHLKLTADARGRDELVSLLDTGERYASVLLPSLSVLAIWREDSSDLGTKSAFGPKSTRLKKRQNTQDVLRELHGTTFPSHRDREEIREEVNRALKQRGCPPVSWSTLKRAWDEVIAAANSTDPRAS